MTKRLDLDAIALFKQVAEDIIIEHRNMAREALSEDLKVPTRQKADGDNSIWHWATRKRRSCQNTVESVPVVTEPGTKIFASTIAMGLMSAIDP